MAVYRVCRTKIYSEWAEVEAEDYASACQAFEENRWIGDIGEEHDVEWDVEEIHEMTEHNRPDDDDVAARRATGAMGPYMDPSCPPDTMAGERRVTAAITSVYTTEDED